MLCPNCSKEFEPVATPCFHNVDVYGKSATSVAKCCGAVIRVHSVRTFRLTVEPSALQDDWGNEVPTTISEV